MSSSLIKKRFLLLGCVITAVTFLVSGRRPLPATEERERLSMVPIPEFPLSSPFRCRVFIAPVGERELGLAGREPFVTHPELLDEKACSNPLIADGAFLKLSIENVTLKDVFVLSNGNSPFWTGTRLEGPSGKAPNARSSSASSIKHFPEASSEHAKIKIENGKPILSNLRLFDFIHQDGDPKAGRYTFRTRSSYYESSTRKICNFESESYIIILTPQHIREWRAHLARAEQLDAAKFVEIKVEP